jgi:hypothetical protein
MNPVRLRRCQHEAFDFFGGATDAADVADGEAVGVIVAKAADQLDADCVVAAAGFACEVPGSDHLVGCAGQHIEDGHFGGAEEVALGWLRPALILSIPVSQAPFAFVLVAEFEELGTVAVWPIVPERLTDRTTEGIVVAFRDGGQSEDAPLAFLDAQQAAHEIVLMQGRGDEHDLARGCQAALQVRDEPSPGAVAERQALGFVVGLDGVVDDCEVGAKASDGAADTRGQIAAATARVPQILGVVQEPVAERVGGVADNALHEAGVLLRQ